MTTDGSDLIPDITPLALSDNFYTWFTRTNDIIDAINPLNIYDITPRKGLTESRAGGNVILDVDTGKGLKAYPNDATGSITLDFESLTAAASVSDDDLFALEVPATGTSNDVFKISATNMLPPTLSGNHIFSGTITINELNVNDNVIRLQYGDSTTENDSGLILDTTTSPKVKFTYDTNRSAWFSNRNIGLANGYSFLTDSNQRRADFKFATHGSNQYDVGLELLMGLQSTSSDDRSWIIEARSVNNSLNFIYKSYENTDTETQIFYATIDSPTLLTSTFVIADKIQIGNVGGSTTNFKSVTDYSANIIPISNSNGVLDNEWTNRYVTTQYSGVVVGDIVKILDDTNNQATIVKCSLTSSSDESEAYSLGIVERISGGKAYVVTHGEFSNLSGLNPGAVYYLTSGSPNYTLTKPTSGIVKPIFVATSATGGIFFPMNAQGLSFGRFNAVATSGGTLVSGNTVESEAPNDIFTLDAGAGISLETDPVSKKIIIRASTLGNQPTYSSISTNSGTVNAYDPGETLSLIGSGGISVSAIDTTNSDQITISGSYFRTISWNGDATDDISGSITATTDDTLEIYAGTGISIQSYGDGFRIDATGDAVSTIADNSVALSKLINQQTNSVLVANPTFGGDTSPRPVSILTAPVATPSILTSNGINVSWQLPNSTVASHFASVAATSNAYGITTTRQFGIMPLSKTATNLSGKTPTDVAAFRYITSPVINGGIVGLQEGNGITLTLLNTTTNSVGGLPTIKISCDYAPSFSGIYIEDTGETIVAATGETLKFTSTSSPIVLDSDTNSDTVNFGIATNSITNNYLATMADNTVKVGTGSTNADNSPQDLAIGANSVLGRVGSGDLKSISATELNTILTGKYFTSVQTNSGSIDPTDTQTLTIIGGSGITVSIDTDNRIVIDSSGGGGGNGITEIYDWDGTAAAASITGLEKLYFQKGDFAFELSNNGLIGGVVKPKINWDELAVNSSGNTVENGGAGLIYGFGAANLDGASITTRFIPIGNNEISGSRLPVIDAESGILSYIKRIDATQTDTIDRVLGFKGDGTLVATDKFISAMSFSGLTGLSFSITSGTGTITASPIVTFSNLQTTTGIYFGPGLNTGLVMYDGGTNGKSEYILCTNENLYSAWDANSYVTSLFVSGWALSLGGTYTKGTSTEIKTRFFGSSGWANLSAANSPRICMPSFMIGNGPNASTETEGSGVYLRNENNSLTFTNYNLLSNASRTIETDRSCRLGLEVLNVDSGTTSYANTKNTAYITHTYVPSTLTNQEVDKFTINSGTRKSYKYLVHAQNSTGDFYTTELLVQIKGDSSSPTVNIIQYGSSTTNSSLSGLTFSIEATATTATLKHNQAAGSLDIKLIKYEI